MRGKWARDAHASLADPKEREARRREAQRQREMEDRLALEEEAKRQEERRRQKVEEKKREEEEEIERKMKLEEELRLIAAERERKRIWEEEEERRKKKEMEERKRADRERRSEEHRRLEQWRREREQRLAEEARRAEEQREREEQERQRKIQLAEKLVVQHQAKPAVNSGWVTIQFNDSLFWKRRYYRFNGGEILLYRSPKEKDIITPLETVQVHRKVRALKEWKDGYEELEAIPFSFVVEFNDEQQAWSMFSDSEEEKFLFLGLLRHASEM